MNKINAVLLMVGLMVSTVAYSADWTLVATDNHGMKSYVSPERIRRDANLIKMWVLDDYDKVQKDGRLRFFSSSSKVEFNCSDETMSVVTTLWYSKHMAKGDVVNSRMVYDVPSPVVPDSVGEVLWKVACDNKQDSQ